MAKVSVSVSDDYLDRFGEVADAARGAGLDIERQLKVLGILSGSIDPSRMEELQRVPGVQSVEQEHEYQLDPPESGIQSISGSDTGGSAVGADDQSSDPE